MQLDDFTKSYIETALWSSHNIDFENDPEAGEYLDRSYEVEDIDANTLKEIVQDCNDFQQANAKWLTDEHLVRGGDVAKQAGQDFWLTRNGHGAGFWDGDWSIEAGKALTAASKVYGSVDLYPSNGKIYA